MFKVIDIEYSRGRKNILVNFGEIKEYISYDTLLKYNLTIGSVLSKEEICEAVSEDQLAEYKKAAHNYISYKPRTEHQVRIYLLIKGAEASIIDAVVSFLKDFDLIDDVKYATSYVNDLYLKRPMGRKMVAHNLQKRGIGSDTAAKAINGISTDDERDNLRKIILKKYKGKITKSIYENQKVIKYLQGRGFVYADIEPVLQEYIGHKS